jgi:hypothetical protein
MLFVAFFFERLILSLGQDIWNYIFEKKTILRTKINLIKII